MHRLHCSIKLLFIGMLTVLAAPLAIAQEAQISQQSSLWVLDGLGQVSTLAPTAEAATDEFYYYLGEGEGEKVMLTLNPEWVFVSFISHGSEELKIDIVDGIPGLEDWSLREGDDFEVSLRVEVSFQNQKAIFEIIEQIAEISIVNYVGPRFVTSYNSEVAPTNNFYVKFNPLNIPLSEPEEINSLYGVKIVKRYPSGAYFLKAEGKASLESIRLANIYHGLSNVSISEPNMIMFYPLLKF